MNSIDDLRSCYTRRHFLSASLSIASAGALSLLFSNDVTADSKLPDSQFTHTMAALILIRYLGLIRTAIITSQQGRNWNLLTSIISKGESPVVRGLLEWALTIKATELRSAHPQRITDICRENTLRVARHIREHSLIYDSLCFRGRLLLKIKFTIFILLFPPQGYIG